MLAATADTSTRERAFPTLGRYTLVSVLGAGGMGVVYEAWDPRDSRAVALKVMRPGDDSEARLVREGRVMTALRHPNVVAAFEVDSADDRVFIAMELVRGTTLATWARDPSHGLAARLEMLLGAARGLAAAHAANVVHRDFKPDNVLIGPTGTPQVSDFGVARLCESSDDPDLAATRLTHTGAVIGTPAYMSPEQAEGLPATAAADQFSFCVTAWELLAGQRPFLGPTAAVVMANIVTGTLTPAAAEATWPGALRRLLHRGLAIDPRARFASMDELAGELARIAARLPRRRRSRGGRIAAACAVAALLGLGATLGAAAATSRLASHDDAPQVLVPGLAPARDDAAGPRIIATSADTPPPRAIAPAGQDRAIAVTRPRVAARAMRPAALASVVDAQRAEVTRLGWTELPLVDGIRAERRLRTNDIPGYADAVARTRAAIERGDEQASDDGMHEMRMLIDGVTVDAAFVAGKRARIAAKLADATGDAALKAELGESLLRADEAAARGDFAAANEHLDLVARHLASEI